MYIFEGSLNSHILSPNLHSQVEVIHSYSTQFFVFPVSVMWHILGASLEQSQENWTAELLCCDSCSAEKC